MKGLVATMEYCLHFKKSVALFLSVSLLSALFCSCEIKPPQEQIPKSDTPVWEYTLVRGDSSGTTVLHQVITLKNVIENHFGHSPSSSTDWAVDTQAPEESINAKEILIGITNRVESTLANSELSGKYGYIIRSINDKIVITATSELLLDNAIEHFVCDYLKKSEDGCLPSYINVTNIDDSALYLIKNQSGKVKIVIPEKASSLLFSGVKSFCNALRPFCYGNAEFVSGDVPSGVAIISFNGKTGFPESIHTLTIADKQWQVYCENDCIIVKGSNDLTLLCAFSALFEYLTDAPDRTLEGLSMLFYHKNTVLRESWEQGVPRIIGGIYLGTEQIGSSSTRSYYQNISPDDINNYYSLLENPLNYKLTRTHDSVVYTSVDCRTEIIIDYNSATGDLSIVEISL